MPCLNKLGSIDIPDDLKLLVKELSQTITREGPFGVTELKNHRWDAGLEFLENHLGLSIPEEMTDSFQHAALLRAAPLEMHDDAIISSKYGIMVLTDVPDGACLRYWRSEPIPIKSGDIISIRYSQKHELHMEHEGDRLLWLTIDFDKIYPKADDLWLSALEAKRLS